MKVLIGQKLGMLQQLREDGAAWGVTAVEVWPATVTRLRTATKDGYAAMQVGAGEKRRGTKGDKGQGNGKAYTFLGEFPLASEAVKAGDTLGIDQVAAGESLQISATSKGKGFQGTIKRHNFSRGPMTHGSRNQRRPGSIGGVDAARVFPGQKMPGRMGHDKVTLRNVKVAAVHTEENVILLKGAVPGPTGAIVTLISNEPAQVAAA